MGGYECVSVNSFFLFACLRYHYSNHHKPSDVSYEVQVNISIHLYASHPQTLTPTPHHILGETENFSFLTVDSNMQDGTGVTLQHLQYSQVTPSLLRH